MALPPDTLDVKAAEDALSHTMRTALYEARRLCGVEAADRWHLHPRLGPFFLDMAILRLVRIAQRRNPALKPAVEEACRKLNIESPESVRSRIAQHRTKYRDMAAEWEEMQAEEQDSAA